MFIHFKPRVVQLLYRLLQPPPEFLGFFFIIILRTFSLDTFFFFYPHVLRSVCGRPSVQADKDGNRCFRDLSSMRLAVNVRKDAVENVQCVLPVSSWSRDKPHHGLRLLPLGPCLLVELACSVVAFARKEKNRQKKSSLFPFCFSNCIKDLVALL